MSRPPSSERGLWLAIVAGLTLSIVVYGMFATAMVSIRDDGPPGESVFLFRPVFYAVSTILLVVSALIFRKKLDGAWLPLTSFRSVSIVCLVLAEASALLGLVLFFMTRDFYDFLIMGGGALVLILGYILPAGLRYFARDEEPA